MAHRILVPFELPDAEPLSPNLVDDIAGFEVVILGHYSIPEQTPREMARNQFGEDAEAELESLAAPLRDAGATVTTKLVFGKAREETIDRVALEENCDAELDPARTDRIERILVPLLDTENFDRLTDFVSSLLEETTSEITLFHVAEAGERADEVESMLRAARDRMIERGFEAGLVNVAVVEDSDHDSQIIRMADEYDAVVMDEADPSIKERIFGTLADRIADRTGDPVIIVRRNL